MNNMDAIYMLSDQISALNEKISKLQDLTYAQVLMMAANNPLLDGDKRINMFNQAMTLIERDDVRVQETSSQGQELPSDFIR